MSNPYCEEFERWWKKHRLNLSLNTDDDKPLVYEAWKIMEESTRRLQTELDEYHKHVTKQIAESTELLDNSKY